MCGICGVWRSDAGNGEVRIPALRRMCGVLTHRGPDGQGLYLQGQGRRLLHLGTDASSPADETGGRIGLGHRRLSIIDLVTGAQPLSNEDCTIWVVFNGEIYNFQELRSDLEAKGHCFKTSSDTETIVHLYEDYGKGCVKFLQGMFAFALWDEQRQKLLLARDRFGIKPLFYSWDGQRLLFGSEIKAILAVMSQRDLDMDALHDYLSLNYIPGPGTIYRQIRKLQPGHLIIGERDNVQIEQYWDLPRRPSAAGNAGSRMREEDVAAELLERFRKVVAAHMVSDVPLGVFLSGGLDSSTIVALMSMISNRPVQTFSIGFDEPSFDETPMARMVSTKFHTDHEELILRPDIRDLLPVLVRSFDEPFADSSAIPTYYVARLARSRVTVALGGDGGDEIFAGYDTYVASKLAGAYRRLPRLLRRWCIEPLVHRLPTSEAKVSFDYKAKRFIEAADLPVEQAHVSWKTIFGERLKERLYADNIQVPGRDSFQVFGKLFGGRGNDDLLDRLQYIDIKVYLPDDILVKTDRMSMANSLELRVPFLDHEFVEFVISLPSNMRLNLLTKKYILKKAVKGLLPPEIVRGRKRGFNVPIGGWLRRELRDMVNEYLSDSTIKRQGYFNERVVAEIVRHHQEKKADYSRNIWGLLMFGLWLEHQDR